MNDLKAQIAAGEWKQGDKLPSVVELAALFGVGRSTIREALSALKAVGMLDIRQGGGTYIR
ncbi:winged helix-turn-helix domain-containing protein, partial [Paenibacillus sepulcri]|nr:winged helix-turn-helix domain-containing protein [Paenibacillus sepulcri]